MTIPADGPLLPPHPDLDGPAVTVGDAALGREELFAAAAAVADRVHGAPAVAVRAAADLRTVVAVTGCLLAGVPVVPVGPDSGAAERAHLLADSGAALWLGEPVDGLPVEAVPVEPGARSATVRPEPPADAVAMIMYTSGTTGPPKGALLSRRAIAAGLDGLADAWAWTPEDVLVHGLPLFHVHGLILGVLGALRTGSPLVHTLRPGPAGYAGAVTARGGTLLFGVPTVWSRIAADPSSARALAPARLLVSGSAPLPVPVARELARHTGHTPVERYGMTETLITLAQRADGQRRPGRVGTPIAGVQARIVDDAGQPAPADGSTPGDLQVRGATLFDGYLGRPDPLTPDGWFPTGDVAAMDGDGHFRIVGRKSTDLIKSGGYRIGAGEIETALLGHPAVAEAAVVGLPDPDLGQRVVAFVVRREGFAAEPADLVAEKLVRHVAGQLSAHKRPREIRFVAGLPRNHMGKVQKRRLTE
ncbi:acyl-CoA synthetase [Streptomyces aidingensis]|uniref:Fatty acid CoA ligase FadD36 n=1 Tax=Streptomyces aidingensis TaxID=910347 RepID=A0A1I1HHA1_9ACTN|nr:acyl-CoA synthetase [Streptomyces aidingensis]SFC23186.1 fatty acid CoA ligase FadD36 [Streptomyces aidingensis]